MDKNLFFEFKQFSSKELQRGLFSVIRLMVHLQYMGKLEDLLEFQNEHIETKIVFYDSSWNSTFLFGAQDLNIKLTMSFKFH